MRSPKKVDYFNKDSNLNLPHHSGIIQHNPQNVGREFRLDKIKIKTLPIENNQLVNLQNRFSEDLKQRITRLKFNDNNFRKKCEITLHTNHTLNKIQQSDLVEKLYMGNYNKNLLNDKISRNISKTKNKTTSKITN